jgi:hypothetical protein
VDDRTPALHGGARRATIVPMPNRLLHRLPHCPLHRLARCCLLLTAAALVAGCASLPPAPGAPAAAWRERWGEPGAVHRLPDGGVRWEYASGPWGRSTWMLDLDPAGRLVAARQVLTAPALAAFQQQADGLARDAVRAAIGRPGETRRVGLGAGREVWSWRYETNDCLWFEAEFDDGGRVQATGFAIDPACDAGDRE